MAQSAPRVRTGKKGEGQAPVWTVTTSASVQDDAGLMREHCASWVTLQHLETPASVLGLVGVTRLAKTMALPHENRPRSSAGDEPLVKSFRDDHGIQICISNMRKVMGLLLRSPTKQYHWP